MSLRLNYSNPVSQHGLNDGLVGWWKVLPNWRGGNTLRDLTGQNHGTLTNMNGNDWVSSSQPGSFGALNFDDTDDLVITNRTFSGSEARTFAIWERKTGTGQATTMWCGINGTSERFQFLVEDGELAIRILGSAITYTATGSDDGNWHHIALSMSAGDRLDDIRCYLDGISVTIASGSTTVPNTSSINGVRLGGRLDNSEPWDGDLDDARVYNRALSTGEIWNLYNLSRQRFSLLLNWKRRSWAVKEPVVAPTTLAAAPPRTLFLNYDNLVSSHGLNKGLVSWWKVLPHYKGGRVLQDLAGRNNGVIENVLSPNRVSSPRPGGYGTLNFTAVSEDERVTIPPSTTLQHRRYTASCWFYARTNGNRGLVGKQVDGTWVKAGAWTLYYGSGGAPKFRIRDGIAIQNDQQGSSLSTNTWHHMCGTLGAGEVMNFYINGIIADTPLTLANPAISGSGDIWIGDYTPAAGEWDGYVDDVRYYNRALSAGDVWSLYNLSRKKYSPLLNWKRRSWAVKKEPDVAPTTLSVSSPRTLFLNYSNPVSSHGLNDGLVGWWKVLSGRIGGTTFHDLLGRNNGTLIGMAGSDWVTSSRPGAFGQLAFDGSDGPYVDCGPEGPARTLAGSAYSVSVWAYLDATFSDLRAILSKDQSSQFPFSFRNSAGKLNFVTELNNLISPSVLPTKKWIQITCTFGPAGKVIYLDGIAVNNNSFSTVQGDNGDSLYFGTDNKPSTGRNFNGKIDDVRVYDRALSAGDVWSLYSLSRQRFSPLLNWKRRSWAIKKEPDVAPPVTTLVSSPRTLFLNYQNPVSQHGLNEGLVSWWKVLPGHMGGSIFRDLMGRNHGTINSVMSPVRVASPARPGGYGTLNFTDSADNERVTIPAITIGTRYSIAFWFNTNGASNTQGFVAHPVPNFTSDGSITFWVTDAALFRFRIYDGSSGSNTLAIGGLPSNQWIYICGTLGDVDLMNLYQDGIITDSMTLANAPVAATGDLMIGDMDVSNSEMDGFIDDVRLYDRELSASDVWSLYSLSRQRYSPLLNWNRRKVAGIPVEEVPPVGGLNPFNSLINSESAAINPGGLIHAIY